MDWKRFESLWKSGNLIKILSQVFLEPYTIWGSKALLLLYMCIQYLYLHKFALMQAELWIIVYMLQNFYAYYSIFNLNQNLICKLSQ